MHNDKSFDSSGKYNNPKLYALDHIASKSMDKFTSKKEDFH